MHSFITLTIACLVSSTIALVIPQRRATVCNGRAELCSRPYGNVTFFGSHDSFASSSNPLDLARTQAVDLTSQMNLGVRFLQAQAHMDDGELHFCHTSCLLFDGGKVVDYLTTVKTFLDANPNEVMTLLFTNPEGQSMNNVWKPAFVNSGIADIAYAPSIIPVKRSDWPTLGELIDSGKRVITFIDAGADTAGDTVDFLLPEFPMLWEPPFSETDPSFPCRVDRIAGPLSTEDHLSMLNHNLNDKLFGSDDILIPAFTDAGTTNSVNSILANANGCAPLAGGVAPNFVMLDFVNIGQGKQAVDTLNGF